MEFGTKQQLLYRERICLSWEQILPFREYQGEGAKSIMNYNDNDFLGSTLKGKNLLPLGANSFLLEKTKGS